MIELDFHVDVTNMVATLTRGERQLDENIDEWLDEGKNRIVAGVKSLMPVFESEAIDSIVAEPFSDGDVEGYRIHSDLDDQAKMLTIEHGRQPGAKPPPAKALLPWVQEKWGGDMGDAFGLAKYISEHGSHNYPTGHRPFHLTAQNELPLLEYLAAEIVNIF